MLPEAFAPDRKLRYDRELDAFRTMADSAGVPEAKWDRTLQMQVKRKN